MAAEGAKVVVNYGRSEKEAKEVVAAITKAGGTAVVAQADIGKPADIPGLFAATTKAFGKLDILVNNAAIMQRTFLPDVTAELIDAHFNINVRGYLLCAKHAAELMTERRQHHQRRQRHQPHGLSRRGGLLRDEGGGGRDDSRARGRAGAEGNPRQRARARIDAHRHEQREERQDEGGRDARRSR